MFWFLLWKGNFMLSEPHEIILYGTKTIVALFELLIVAASSGSGSRSCSSFYSHLSFFISVNWFDPGDLLLLFCGWTIEDGVLKSNVRRNNEENIFSTKDSAQAISAILAITICSTLVMELQM